MATGQIRLTDMQKTALSTLYGKALDAGTPDPILGDTLAERAVHELDFDFATLKVPPGAQVSLPVRAKHLDGWARDFVTATPDCVVLHLGAGLDTRVYRVDPPAATRWYDVDLPELIALRQQLYPARPGYTMIETSVTDPAWLDQAAADLPVIVVAEGLVMHVPTPEVAALLRRITERFPRGEIVFDVYSAFTARVISWGSRLGGTPVHLHAGLPHVLAGSVPTLRLADSVPFLTLPDLVSRLGRGVVSTAYFRAVRAGFQRNSMLHLRYRFG